ncbi:MAG: hypothetical protein P8I96_08510 [Opitutae bacterium]|nr:hypothetical protein [Opitutae bacterium]
MRAILLYASSWLLPVMAVAEVVPVVALRLVEGIYRTGDVVEVRAEMRRDVYAEFELHVPEHPKLHFVALTPEPVRYVKNEYLQRSTLLLQPMCAGEFELTGFTVTVAGGEHVREEILPPLKFRIESYANENLSPELALLEGQTNSTDRSNNKLWLISMVCICVGIWWRMHSLKESKAIQTIDAPTGVRDVIEVLEEGASSTTLIEELLGRSDVMLSFKLRRMLEAAVYSKGTDFSALLRQLKAEVQE